MTDKNEKPQFNSDDLIIPIYIDTSALLDVLATTEKGFSFVEKVVTNTSKSITSEKTAGATLGTDFGTLNILNLFKITLSGSIGRTNNHAEGQNIESQRYHTYGSLLQRLRSLLLRDKLLTKFSGVKEDWSALKPHSFVEIRGKFRLNPLTGSLETLDRLLKLLELFAKPQNSANRNKPKLVTNTTGNLPLEEIKKIRIVLQGMIDDLENQDIRILVIDLENSYHAVAYIFKEYLRDHSMTELLNKEYKLLGKIVDKKSGQNESISLIQGTGIGGLDDTSLAEFISKLSELKGTIKLPEIETEIKSPALQIIPIAIYV